jgi:cell division protein FtsB
MRKSIKIWFHSGGSSDIKELSLHKAVLSLFFFFSILAILGLSYMGYDYYQLKSIAFNNHVLSDTIDKQTNEIKNQRRQIQSFAGEIEVLKNQVLNLSQFEDKVRLIADIKQTSDSSGLIGIGGIPEEELDQDIPLEKTITT